MQLSPMGNIAEQCWNEIPEHFPHVELKEFVLMPNHLHGILCITAEVEAPVGANNHSINDARQVSRRPKGTSKTIGSIVRGFKIGVTKWARGQKGEKIFAPTIWQRNYYEHVIRDESDYARIAEYILNNPHTWMDDSLHPEFVDMSE